MKRYFPRLLTASLAFIIGLWSAGSLAYQIGCIHAYIDIARGHHELQLFGIIGGDLEEFSEIAANDYGIEVFTHGCIISTQGIEPLRGYNETSLAAIKRKYGADVMDVIWDRAQQQYRAKQLTRKSRNLTPSPTAASPANQTQPQTGNEMADSVIPQ